MDSTTGIMYQKSYHQLKRRVITLQKEVEELKDLLKRKNSVLTQYDRDWEFIEENFSLLEPFLKAIREKLAE